jgi:hypothetical protein
MAVDYDEGRRLLAAWKAEPERHLAHPYDLTRFLLSHAEALLNPDPWRGIEELPEDWKDGRWIEAVVAKNNDERLHLSAGRVFVIRHDGVTRSGFNMGWSVYPGYGGASDRTFSHFRELKGPGQ